jgi:hypothetical protein
LKQHKKLEELKVDNANAYQAKNKVKASWPKACTNGQKFVEANGL